MHAVQTERSEGFDGSRTCWHIALGHITLISQSLLGLAYMWDSLYTSTYGRLVLLTKFDICT